MRRSPFLILFALLVGVMSGLIQVSAQQAPKTPAVPCAIAFELRAAGVARPVLRDLPQL